MNVIIHRGSHQIGGSCIEVFSNKTRIILDIGETLPALGDKEPKPLASSPRVQGLYKNQEKHIDAVLVSHGHGDHIGLIENIHPEIPVFIGEKALRIYNMTARFIGRKAIVNPTYYFESGKEIPIGDFVITPYLVDHSGFDAYGFLIKHGDKHMVYTGDFRAHGRKPKATEYFITNISKDIDLLLTEGTMMSRVKEKIDTEEEIEKKAYEFMQSKTAPVLVLQSSTNIDRLVGMYKAAKNSGRTFIMDVFTANIVSQLEGSIPRPGVFNKIRVYYPKRLTKRMFEENKEDKLMKQFSRYYISKKELGERNDYCMLIRDTMLEDLEGIENLKGAGFIYSLWSGYKVQTKMKQLLAFAKHNNMEIIDLHTSGHASIETLQKIIKDSGAKKVIPIHTESPDLFTENFENVYIAKDGEVIFI